MLLLLLKKELESDCMTKPAVGGQQSIKDKGSLSPFNTKPEKNKQKCECM